MNFMDGNKKVTGLIKGLILSPSLLLLVGCLGGESGGSSVSSDQLGLSTSNQAKIGVFMEADASVPTAKRVVVTVDRVSIRNEDGESVSVAGSGQQVELTDKEVALPNITLSEGQRLESREIRLILMNTGNEFIREDGSVCELKTPSAQQSGLKIKLPDTFTIEAGLRYSVHLAFDVEKSVVEQGNGGCLLKPVIHGEIISYRPPVDDGSEDNGGSTGGDTGSGNTGDTTGGDTGTGGGTDTGTGSGSETGSGDVQPVTDVVYQPDASQIVETIQVEVSN